MNCSEELLCNCPESANQAETDDTARFSPVFAISVKSHGNRKDTQNIWKKQDTIVPAALGIHDLIKGTRIRLAA